METPKKFILKHAIPRHFMGQDIPIVSYYTGSSEAKRSGNWEKDPNQAVEMTEEEIKVVLSRIPTGVINHYSKVLKQDAIATWNPADWRNEDILTLDDLKERK